MARIAGVDLPRNKRVEIGLTAIYGIGRSTSSSILKRANIDVNIRIKNLTDDNDKVFLPSNELRTLYEEAGIAADKEIVTHCQTGIRAAHSYFALRLLGYPKVRLYDGSWAEWGNDPETPIVSDKPPR